MKKLGLIALGSLLLFPVGAFALFGSGGGELEEIRETQKKILERLDAQDKVLQQILQKSAGGRPAGPDPNAVHEIPLAHSYFKGPKDAKVTIVEFSDFQCPFCARETGLMNELLGEFPKDLKFVYKHMPLTRIHPQAMLSAKASMAAGKQGKFWEMHDALFENYRQLSPEKIQELAEGIGLDAKKFEKDLADPEIEKLVQKDMELAGKVGVRGTPTFYLNGKRIQNRQKEALAAQIRQELEKKK